MKRPSWPVARRALSSRYWRWWQSAGCMTPEQRYESLVKSILSGSSSARVGEGKGFGSTGQLKVEGKIFAMLVRGKLVLKLPCDRVDGLVASGDGEHFDAGKGRPMREWLALSPTSRKRWLALAQEAMTFVSRNP